MKSKHEIDVDFEVAMKQARKLHEISAEMRLLANNDMEGNLQSIAMNWKGDNASAYLSKGKIIENRISDTSKNIEAAATVIENIAKRIHETEMRAYEEAQRREYD